VNAEVPRLLAYFVLGGLTITSDSYFDLKQSRENL